MLGQAIYRAIVMIALGIYPSSPFSKMTSFSLVYILSQIGLGYVFVFLLLGKGLFTQFLTALGILAGYWLAFALYPLPGPEFDYASVGVSKAWNHPSGFFAHWDRNTNFASAFDLIGDF